MICYQIIWSSLGIKMVPNDLLLIPWDNSGPSGKYIHNYPVEHNVIYKWPENLIQDMVHGLIITTIVLGILVWNNGLKGGQEGDLGTFGVPLTQPTDTRAWRSTCQCLGLSCSDHSTSLLGTRIGETAFHKCSLPWWSQCGNWQNLGYASKFCGFPKFLWTFVLYVSAC
jgi:hypothetical protein